MGFARFRLFAVVGLLVAWLGYIAYQAVSVGRFPVVSHSQLLVSTLDVIAQHPYVQNPFPSLWDQTWLKDFTQDKQQVTGS